MRLIVPVGKAALTMRAAALAVTAAVALVLASCASEPVILTAAEQPLPTETLAMLGKKGMTPEAPIFVRIFKEESELEVWKARADGRFYHLKTYPICNWSGDLGPKLAQGDKQAPEGFYNIASTQMNPNSQFHVAFNMGFPNAYDRANNRTGQSLMVHGKCKSAGCYAMTDALVEEIYALARESFKGGQLNFAVHAFPFRMTDEKLARFTKHKWHGFWKTLKQGYDYFEVNRVPPQIAVCERRYVVDVMLPASGRLDPEGRCPAFQRPALEPFAPQPAEGKIAEERVTVPGPKTRDVAEVVDSAGKLNSDGDGWMSTASTNAPARPLGSTAPASGMPAGATALGFNQ
ncbi:MAG: murein L,D-transpeptidase family protein [Hyphomicrobium sp.]